MKKIGIVSKNLFIICLFSGLLSACGSQPASENVQQSEIEGNKFIECDSPEFVSVTEGEEAAPVFTSLPEEYEEAFRRVLWGEYSLIEGAGENNFSFIQNAMDLREGKYICMDVTFDGLDECVINAEKEGRKYYYILQYQNGNIKILCEVCLDDYRKVRLWDNGTLILDAGENKRYKGTWDICKKEYVIEQVSVDADTWYKWITRGCSFKWTDIREVYSTDYDIYFLNYQWDNQIAGNDYQVFYSNAEDHFYLYTLNFQDESVLLYAEPVRSIYQQDCWIYFTERGERNRLCRILNLIGNESKEYLTDFSVVSLLKVGERFCFLSDDAPDIKNPKDNQFYLYSMNTDGSDVQRLQEEPCVSYESDGRLLYVTLEVKNHTVIRQLDITGKVLNPDCETGLIWAKRADFPQLGERVLDDEEDFHLLMGMYALDNLPSGELEAYQELFSGNYSRMEGAGEENFSFIDDVIILWEGSCIVLDADGDGKKECCLQVRDKENYWKKVIYVLRYQKDSDTIRLVETYPYEKYDDYEELAGFKDGAALFSVYGISWETLNCWQSVLDALSDDYKIYFMNFNWDNPIGSRGNQIYYSNPIGGYYIYVTEQYDSPGEVVFKMPARSIYVERDGIYFTNFADENRLYCNRTNKGEKVTERLTDFSVKKLLKIKERFYFLSDNGPNSVEGWHLYSMLPDGTDVKCLSMAECPEYWSDGKLLFCTFMENGSEVQREVDLQGNMVAEGFPDRPVMASRGDYYMTESGMLRPGQGSNYLFFVNHPDWEYEIREELTAEGTTKSGTPYSICVPQFSQQLAGAAQINKMLEKLLADGSEQLEQSYETKETVQIRYDWYYTRPYWLSVCFYEEATGQNPYEFLKPITFLATTGKELIPAELFGTPAEEYQESILEGIQSSENVDSRIAEEYFASWQGSFYSGMNGMVLCFEPQTLLNNTDWREIVVPYEDIGEDLVRIHEDRYVYPEEDANLEKMDGYWDPGTELSYQFRIHYNDTYVPGVGMLNKEEYYERPVILGDSQAAGGINQVLSMEEGEFFTEARQQDSLTGYCMSQRNRSPGYYFTRSAYVPYNKNGIFSTVINYEWYAGGVLDYGWDTYNFYADTGERFYLKDVFEEDADVLRQKIYDIFYEDYEWSSESILSRNLEDFDFAFEETEIVIFFAKYEVGCGADGAQTVRIPYDELHFKEDFPLSRIGLSKNP